MAGRLKTAKGFAIGMATVALAFGATLMWPKASTQPSELPASNDTAYWAKRASVEVEREAALRASRALTPPPRTTPPVGLDGELDSFPVRPARLAAVPSSGRRMFASCRQARAAGYQNIPAGHPAYHPDMDGDDDGYACEPIRR